MVHREGHVLAQRKEPPLLTERSGQEGDPKGLSGPLRERKER